MLWCERSSDEKKRRIDLLTRAVMTIVAAAACMNAACSGNQASPTASTTLPTPPITPQPAPPAPAATFALRGRVTQAPPTTTTEVPGARVTITDGVNAGRFAIADVYGFYSIKDLAIGTITVKVTADYFVSTTTQLAMDIAGETTQNFHLMPVPDTLSYSLPGDISPTDGTCSDGESMKPCRITVMPVHNEGMIEVTLNWEPASSNLEVTLFQTGSSAPIAKSVSAGAGKRRVSARVSGGSTYEFRITYASGKENVKYTLAFSCPS